MKRLVIPILFFSHSLMATPSISAENIQSMLKRYFSYLVKSQVDCEGDYSRGDYICNNKPGERLLQGGWESHVVFSQPKFKHLLNILDPNMFITTHTLVPMYFLRFEDPTLESQRLRLINQSLLSLKAFKKETGGYVFWPKLNSSLPGGKDRHGALNKSNFIYHSNFKSLFKLQNWFHYKFLPSNIQSIEENFDFYNSNVGIDSVLNIPADADDTALALLTQFYYFQSLGKKQQLYQLKNQSLIFKNYVDNYEKRSHRSFLKSKNTCQQGFNQSQFKYEPFLKQCSFDDPREYWRYSYKNKHSGAFLTWFFDESLSPQQNQELGYFTTGQNSVDCNVLANVLNAVATTGVKNHKSMRPHYINSCNAISHIILNDKQKLRYSKNYKTYLKQKLSPTWRQCGLYYPSSMVFAYQLSKAITDGGACQDLEKRDQQRFNKAISVLVDDIVTEQDKNNGVFYEPLDRSTALSTALAGVAMINLSQIYRDEKYDWQKRIYQTVHETYQNTKNIKNGSSFLPEGSFFSAGGLSPVVVWKSKAFTTAVALELFSKYLLQLEPSYFAKVLYLGRNHFRAVKDIKVEWDESLDQSGFITAKVPQFKQKQNPIHVSTKLKFSNNTRQGVIAIEYTHGTVYSGKIQASKEVFSVYKYKINAEADLDLMSTKISDLNIEVKFLGHMTKQELVSSLETASLPITYRKQKEIQTLKAHMKYLEVGFPLYKSSKGWQINFDVMAKLIGFKYIQGGDKISHLKFSFAEVKSEIAAYYKSYKVYYQNQFDIEWNGNMSVEKQTVGIKKNNKGPFDIAVEYEIRDDELGGKEKRTMIYLDLFESN